MTSIEIPNLKASERAFQLDSGDIAVVSITDAESTNDTFLVLRIECRLVNTDGTPVLSAKGVPIKLPTSHTATDISLLGDPANDTTPDTVMAAETANVVDRMTKYATGLRAWHASVPTGDA